MGGLSSLPNLRQDLVATGSVTEKQIVEALAIGRLSTGPSGLFVVSLGYFALGWLGAGMALVASSLPPLAIVPAAALIRRQLLSGWFAGLVRGVALTTSGLTASTAVRLVSPGTAIGSIPPWQIALAVAAAVITVQGKLHPAILVVAGALVGVALGR